jgi:MFS family permease
MPLEADENAGQGEKGGQSEHTARAWLSIAGSCLVYFVSFGYMNSFGYFQDFYSQDYLSSSSSSVIAFIGSLQFGLMYLVGPFSGIMFDTYGPKVGECILLCIDIFIADGFCGSGSICLAVLGRPARA